MKESKNLHEWLAYARLSSLSTLVREVVKMLGSTIPRLILDLHTCLLLGLSTRIDKLIKLKKLKK